MPVTYTTAQIAELLESVSNWGRWGKDDQRGALNYITDEKRAAAARLVRTGETVSLSLPLAIAAFGYLNPIIAAAAMALSSLTVIVNSTLLRRLTLSQS